MKILHTLIEKDEIHSFVEKLWKSDAFKQSYADRGFIYDQVERFAWLPRIFAEATNDHLERAHFCTWWNVIMMREYDNPVIHDLYYLHEFCHAATMPYTPDVGRNIFDAKMRRNELEASVLSEIQVYFELPGLRDKSFDHTIYADRYLDDPRMQALWKANPNIAIETIRIMRRDVMQGKAENLMDGAERWIRRFAQQNEAYSITWADDFNKVEKQMSTFQQISVNDRNCAMRFHLEWLRGKMALDHEFDIPFRAQAEMFAPFYWDTKAKYDFEHTDLKY